MDVLTMNYKMPEWFGNFLIFMRHSKGVISLESSQTFIGAFFKAWFSVLSLPPYLYSKLKNSLTDKMIKLSFVRGLLSNNLFHFAFFRINRTTLKWECYANSIRH